MRKHSIVIADDHLMFRDGIKRIIEENGSMSVVGEAGDGIEVLNILHDIKPDVVILDVSLPKMNGIETAKEIRKTNLDSKILILTMHKKEDYVRHAFAAGVEGFLLKEDSDKDLLLAIETVLRGGVYLSPYFAKLMKDDLFHVSRGSERTYVETLTTREKEVLRLTAEGKSSKEIADILFISARTVDHHRARIMRKLNLKRVADLVKYAIREGYTSEA
jgi:DNA-binding NarL/FixJ family response regulator